MKRQQAPWREATDFGEHGAKQRKQRKKQESKKLQDRSVCAHEATGANVFMLADLVAHGCAVLCPAFLSSYTEYLLT